MAGSPVEATEIPMASLTTSASYAFKHKTNTKDKNGIADLEAMNTLSFSDNFGQTPLHRACIDSNYDDVYELVAQQQSGSGGNERIVLLLIKGRADCFTPLRIAGSHGSKRISEANDPDAALPDALSQIEDDINLTDTCNCTALHIACEGGHTLVVKLLLKHGADANLTNDNGRTALSMACEEGHTQVVELLLEHGADINLTDNLKHTALHIACTNGHAEIVDLLLKYEADVNLTGDIFEYTALHMACMKGHVQVAELLLEFGADINHTDTYKYTALHIACRKGHTKVVKLLLEHGADVTKRYIFGLNPLDIAVEEGQKDAAMAIVNSEKWESALRNIVWSRREDAENCNDSDSDDVTSKSKTQFTTPMRRIIKKMPDVAKVVFDRCCETEESPYDPDYKITYNNEFLDDFDRKWTGQLEYSSQNHCLNILAHSPNADLLKHPLVTRLLDQKWNKYGHKFYYSNLIVYFLFVILLSSFALSVQSPLSSKCIEVFGNDNDTFIDCFPEESFVPQKFISFASVCLIVYSTIMIIREAFQIILFRLQYLTSFANFLEISLFIFTIIFTSVRSNQCYCTHPWQWQIGVIAVFLSWIALIFFVEKLPIVGIYVVMFIKIFNNFIKVVILALLLISAFAIPLYMMFNDPQDKSEGIRTPFITPWRTIVKTVMMTMGEFNMDSLLQQNNQINSPDVQYPVVTFSLIIVFVVLMPILFLNLLTSLAVGDTQEIQKSADTYRLILRVEFTLSIEEFLRSLLTLSIFKRTQIPRKVKSLITVKRKQYRYPNQKKGVLKRAIDEIKGYFTTPQATIADVKNQCKPLSEQMRLEHDKLHSLVSREVKELGSSVFQEVKELRSSVTQLLAIVKRIKKRRVKRSKRIRSRCSRRGEMEVAY
uniref:Ion transport domain-containing protein n=1 Tax=Amphimedon queenslandica TaxID=400682 RepID=A0A1X7TU83_AMPQE